MANTMPVKVMVSASAGCPPGVLYCARWIFFKTVMEGWMHADRPDGIHSLLAHIVDWTSAKCVGTSSVYDEKDASYTVTKALSQNTLLSFANFLQPRLDHVESELQSLLEDPTANIAIDPRPLVSFAKSARSVVSQFTQMIDFQATFARKVRIENFPLGGTKPLTPDQLYLVTWANNVLFDIDQINLSVRAHSNEIQLFLNEVA